MASPGISYWLESTIHSLFHSLCPLGLITINLTPCLSDAAARSAGLGEMFTKAVDHQHFDCGTPNGHYSLWPQWSQQPSVSMISMQWLVPVPEPGKPTWRPVSLCLSFVLLFHLKRRWFLSQILFAVFVFQWTGFSCGLVCCSTLLFSAFCALLTALLYPSPGTYQQVYELEFTTTPWSLCQFSSIVLKKKKEKETDFAIMASFKLDFLPEMMVDHCSLNSSPV